jgi:GTP pyrophosphokinase
MYQSLHTTVIGKLGIPFEVQIRTWEMHQTAEYGIAAHWKYKQNGVGSGEEESFEWVRRLLENQQDTEAEDFIHSLKVDMFDDEVFVFTPKGQVISLPSGSTPIDFAYAIHSEVGNHMVGAKINSRIVNYDTTLSNGDIVEIVTSKSAKGPSRDWLKLCKSNQARNKIKQWYKKERRDDNIAHGKASFEGELRRLGINPSILQNEELLQVVLKKVAFDSLDDMYAAIGYGGLTSLKAVNRVRDELIRANKAVPKESAVKVQKPAAQKKSRHSDSGIIVEDLDNCMIKFSRCCTPVPGDDIVGFITRGYGVSIHRRDCPNAAGAASPEDSGRWVKVAWADDGLSDHFSTTLEIDSVDRDGLVLDIATVLSGSKLKVTELSAKTQPNGRSLTIATFDVNNVSELNTVKQKLLNVQGVTAIRRGHN